MRKLTGPRARTVAGLSLGAFALLTNAPGAAAATSGGWSNLGHGATATLPPIDGKVETFTNVGSKLYVGGDFINAGGLPTADHIATWNGTTWAALGGGLGDAASAVYAIAVDPTSGKVFAGGSFQNAGGDPAADRIAVFDGGSWSSLSGVALNGPVFALAIVGRTLIVGGGFDNVNSIAQADAVAAYGIDGGGWSAITDDPGDIGGTVSSLVPDGSGGLYVGGNFSNANGIAAADFIAHWTGGVSWSALGGSAALNNRVRALAVSGKDVYAAGDFTNAADANGDKVAHWNGSSWSSLGPSTFGDGGNSLYAVVVDHGTVVVAGYFNNAGGARQDGIAAFVDGAWTNVGTSADGTNGPVSLNTTMMCLRVVGAKLYLGGLDSSIADSSMNAYVAWFRFRQPDSQIATTAGFVGNDVYNTRGKGQVLSLTVPRSTTGTFSIKITNDGLATDSFKVRGAGGSGAFAATYLNGATDVTAKVVAGTFLFKNVPAGASRTLTLKVKVGSGAAVGSGRAFLVTATSVGGGSSKDAVLAKVKAS